MPGHIYERHPFMESDGFKKMCEGLSAANWANHPSFRAVLRERSHEEEMEVRIRQELMFELSLAKVGTIKTIVQLEEHEMTEEQRYRFRQTGVKPFGIIECDIIRRTPKIHLKIEL